MARRTTACAGGRYDPRFLFTRPNHKIAVMGPEQLASVMSTVRRGAAECAGQAYDDAEDAAVRAMVGRRGAGTEGPRARARRGHAGGLPRRGHRSRAGDRVAPVEVDVLLLVELLELELLVLLDAEVG